jgi:hypothetical protein
MQYLENLGLTTVKPEGNYAKSSKLNHCGERLGRPADIGEAVIRVPWIDVDDWRLQVQM